jgi:hypothetical protein
MLSRLRPRLTFALAENQSFRGTLMTMGTGRPGRLMGDIGGLR